MKVSIRGKRKEIVVVSRIVPRGGSVYESKDKIFVQTQGAWQPIFYRWWKNQMFNNVSSLVNYWTQRIGISSPRIRIEYLKFLWGKCILTEYSIVINSSLYVMPMKIVELTVVHELTHFLDHTHHSKEFWGVIEKCLPDYKFRMRVRTSNIKEVINFNKIIKNEVNNDRKVYQRKKR